METSSRRIVETDITLTFDEAKRAAVTQNVHELASEAARRTQAICQAAGEVCCLQSSVQANSKTGAETITFRCVSDEDTGQMCNMPNAPYFASDHASDVLYKALAATPKK